MGRKQGIRALAVLPFFAAAAWAEPPPPADFDASTTALEPFQEYGKRVKAAAAVAPLAGAVFGEQVSLYTGSVEFWHVDIDLPGNGALPVRLARRFRIEDQRGLGRLHGFGEWDIDVPHVHGMFSLPGGGWEVQGGDPLARCSAGAAPKTGTATFALEEIWHGTFLHLPGAGDNELLRDDQARTPAITDGTSHPWITRDFTRVGCKAATANGYPGEAFVARTPQGIDYTFDHAVERATTSIKKTHIQGPAGTVPRVHVYLLATRIADRFGNTVDLAYDGDRLQSITASDGRRIVLGWSGNRVVSATATDVSPQTPPRTWTYGYAPDAVGHPHGRLATVTRPDGSAWQFAHLGGLQAIPAQQLPWEAGQPACPEPEPGSGAYQIALTHPAGATGTFTFGYVRHYRTGSPPVCLDVKVPGQQYLQTPNWFDTWSLASRVVAGPALDPMAWNYNYGEVDVLHPCQTPCQQTKDVTVTRPDGTSEVRTFGVAYGVNEGRLLGESVRDADLAALRTVAYGYLPDADVAGQPFADVVGTSLLPLFDPVMHRQRPQTLRSIAQDGVIFLRGEGDFDRFARSRRTFRGSSIGAQRTERRAYHDDTARWVLHQIASVSLEGTALVPESTTYFPATALPETRSTFGQVRHRFGWHADGTLASIADGRDQVTTLDDYRRGTARRIGWPTAASMTAVVNDQGEVTALTDAAGATTAYARDAIGRVGGIGYPAGDTVAWTATGIVHERIPAPEFGFPAGTWRRTETTGARRRATYYDGLWRAVYERSTALDGSAGVRAVRRRFDHAGRVVFASYARHTDEPYTAFTTGVSTSYDALGRITGTTRDSELGPLTTSTQYVAPLSTVATDARGQVTTTSYQAFDEPDDARPLAISAPEGVTTTFVRDVFGKPLTLTRSGMWTGQSLAAVRRFVYDAQQRLCKTIEPDAGTTVIDYDATGNVAWRATGLALPDPAHCDRALVPLSQRSHHGYDAMNRLLGIDHPAGTDDVGFTYAADGALETATAGAGTRTYTYNARRLLESETLSVEGRSLTLDWHYHPRGDLAALTYPDGKFVDFAPNAYGEPRAAGTAASGATYHPTGALHELAYANGVQRTVTLNLRQLPEHLSDSAAGLPRLDHTLGYDANGNLAAIDDATAGHLESRALAYDGRNRLVGVTGAPTGEETYAYDPLDRLRQETRAGVGRVFTYAPATLRLERIVSLAGTPLGGYAWNRRGELETRATPAPAPDQLFAGGFEDGELGVTTARQRLIFDAAGRLLGVPGLESYAYDAHGHRTTTARADGTIRYQVYSRAGRLLYVEDTRDQLAIAYLHLGDTLVARRTTPLGGGATTTTCLHSDHRGTPAVETDAAGHLAYRSLLMPYGAPYDGQYRDGPGFTRHPVDAATRLVYMQQRYYDPEMAGFISPDPMGATAEGFSRYAYANNNPYTFTDPDGRESGAFYTQDRYKMAMPQLTPTQASVALAAQAAVLLGPLAPEAAMAVMSRAPALNNAAVVVGDIAAGDALGGASIGAAAMALKLSGSAHEMFTSARNLIADSAASAAEKVKAFDGLSARISEESGGAWSAAKDFGADGSTIYSGGSARGSNMLVIDPNGKVFTGKMTPETLPASQIPNYEKLREH